MNIYTYILKYESKTVKNKADSPKSRAIPG